jgi:hypothetical protein
MSWVAPPVQARPAARLAGHRAGDEDEVGATGRGGVAGEAAVTVVTVVRVVLVVVCRVVAGRVVAGRVVAGRVVAGRVVAGRVVVVSGARAEAVDAACLAAAPHPVATSNPQTAVAPARAIHGRWGGVIDPRGW